MQVIDVLLEAQLPSCVQDNIQVFLHREVLLHNTCSLTFGHDVSIVKTLKLLFDWKAGCEAKCFVVAQYESAGLDLVKIIYFLMTWKSKKQAWIA